MKQTKILIIILLIFLAVISVQNVNASQNTVTDNFVNLNNWNTVGNVTLSNGEVTFNATQNDPAYIQSKFTYASDWKITCQVYLIGSAATAVNAGSMYANGNLTSQSSLTARSSNGLLYYSKNGSNSQALTGPPLNQWVNYEYDYYKGNNTLIAIINGVSSTHVATYPTVGESFNLKIMGGGTASPSTYYAAKIRSFQITADMSPLTSDVTFNGYCKDTNNNPMQYVNVSLWSGATYYASAITNASGYYTITQVLNNTQAVSLMAAPPNYGVSNQANFVINASNTAIGQNFTIAPVSMVLQAVDADDASIQLGIINVNVSKNGYSPVYYNGVNNPWGYNQSLNLTDYVTGTIGANGYYNQSFTINSIALTTNVITAQLHKNISVGSSSIIFGYTNDQTGKHIQNIPLYLENYTTDAIIDSTISTGSGYFALKAPKVNYPYRYKIVVSYPVFGNQTAMLCTSGMNPYYADGTINPGAYIGTDITYNSNNPIIGYWVNSDLAIDTFNGLSITTSPTPTPSNVPVPPHTYVISGQVVNYYNKNQGVSGLPVYVYQPDGTTVQSQTSTDSNGNFVLSIPDSVTAGWYLVKGGTNLNWYYDSGGSIIAVPNAFKSYNPYTITLYAKPIGNFYSIWGYVKDADKGQTIAKANINIKYPNGTTYINLTSASMGYEYDNIPMTLPSGTYPITVTCSGYSVWTGSFIYPDMFISSGGKLRMDFPLISGLSNLSMSEYRFTIYDNTTGIPISNAQCQIYNRSLGSYVATGYTNAGGHLTLQVLPGVYDISVIADYYQTTYITGDFIDYNNAVSYQIGLLPLTYVTTTPYPTNTPINTPIPSITPTPTPNFFDGSYWGLDAKTMGLVWAFIIICTAMSIVGIFTMWNPIGMGLGAFVGFLLAVADGLIPWEWVIILVAVCISISVIILFLRPKGE